MKNKSSFFIHIFPNCSWGINIICSIKFRNFKDYFFAKSICVQPATMSANFTTVKPRDGSLVIKTTEQKHSDSPGELKTLQENFEKKITWMKAHFEKEINTLKESFNTKAAAFKATTDAQNQTLKEMFDVINRIANAPTLPSGFKIKKCLRRSKNII